MRHEGIQWRAVAAVWGRNFHVYRSTWYLNILPHFFEPVLYLIALGLGLGWYVREIHGVAYVVFLAPALIVMATINGATFEATWNIFVRMNRDRRYDAILTTPINEQEILCGEILWAITRATLYGIAFLLVAGAFGLIRSPAALWIVPLIPFIGYLMATIGIAYGMWIPSMDFLSFYWTCFMTPMFLLSDTFFPIAERLPGWGVAIAEMTPIVHCVRLARAACLGAWHASLGWDLAYIAAVLPLMHWCASKAFRRRLHKPAR